MSDRRIQIIGEIVDKPEDFGVERFREFLGPDDHPSLPTLGRILDRSGVGGWDIEVPDDFGVMQRVSLEAFAHLPRSTYLKVWTRSIAVGRELPDLEPTQLVLRDYVSSGPGS